MFTLNVHGKNKTRKALCASCAHAVIQKGFNGEKLTHCGYGGILRELKFKVSECSIYFDMSVPVQEKPIGYIKPEEPTHPKVTIIKIA